MADRTSERISLEELDADLLEEVDEDVVPVASPGSGPRRIAELAPPIPKPPAPPRMAEPEPEEPEGRVSSERLDLDSIVAGLGEARPPVRPSDFPLPSLEPALPPPAPATTSKKSLGWGAILGVAALSLGVGALAMRAFGGESEAPVVPTAPASPELAVADPTPRATDEVAREAPVERPGARPEAASPAPIPARTVTPSEPPARAASTARAPRRGRTAIRTEASAAPVATAPAAPERAEPARTEPEPVEQATEAPSDLPAQPTRAEVESAILAVAPSIRQCAATSSGHRATITFRFVGSSGRATMATIDAGTLDAAQRSCMARAARNARVPAFSDPQLVVAYPLTI